MDFLRTLQQDCTPSGLRIDIGANEGGYTWSMRQHSPGWIFAFEPVPALFTHCVRRFEDDLDVAVFPFALSDWTGYETGYAIHEAHTLDKPERAAKGRNAEALARDGAGTFGVYFRTIDNLMETQPVSRQRPVQFIKIDTDGYEPKVLRGAVRTIQTHRPSILIELGYLPEDLGESSFAMLDFIYGVLGYRLILQDGREMSRWDWDDYEPLRRTTFDVAMVPQEWDRPLLG